MNLLYKISSNDFNESGINKAISNLAIFKFNLIKRNA